MRRRSRDAVMLAAVAAGLAGAAWWAIGARRFEPPARATPAPETAEPEAPVAQRQPIELRVVRKSDRAPVPGAQVWWKASDRLHVSGDQEAFLRESGTAARSDSAGKVEIPGTDGVIAVVAREGDLYGECTIHSGRVTYRPRSTVIEARQNDERPHAASESPVIELSEDHELVLRAVSPQGRAAAGVMLSPFNYGRTDAEGILRVPHAQRELCRMPTADMAPALREAFAKPIAVRAVGLGPEAPITQLERGAVPAGPVEVAVPACGTLEVALLGPSGEPWQTNAGTQTEIGVRPPPPQAPDLLRDLFSMGASATLGPDGRTELAVPCRKLTVRLNVPPFCETTLAGPTHDGDHVAVTLRMDPRTPIVTGRAIDGDGHPIVGPLQVTVPDQISPPTMTVATDRDGRFRFATRDDDDSARLQVAPDNGPELAGRCGWLRTPGIHDVGDVVLAVPPVLVSGRILRPNGDPFDPWLLQVEFREPSQRSAPWLEAPLGVERTGPGTFEVRALPLNLDYRLRLGYVSGPGAPSGFAMTPVPFAAGSTGLELRTVETAPVEATFLVGADVPLDQMRFVLDPAVRDRGETDDLAIPERVDDSTATCSWRGLVPGRYRLSVSCETESEPILVIDDIEVGAEAVTDPRLTKIDLRDRLHTVTVNVHAPDGSAIRDPAALVVVRGPNERNARWLGRGLEAGVATIVATRPLDLLAAAPGYRAQEIADVVADTDVTLRPAPTVTIRLAEDPPPLPDGTRVVVTLTADAAIPDGICDLRWGSQRLDEVLGSSLRLELGEGPAGWSPRMAGRWSPQVGLSVRRSPSIVCTVAVQTDPASFDADALADGDVVTLHVDAEDWQRASKAANR